MWQQTHIFAGMNVAERQFGAIPEDSVVLEIGTNNNPRFTASLLTKYSRIVAYTFLRINSRNGNHFDARSDIENSPIIWVPENTELLNWIVKSSNAMTILEDRSGDAEHDRLCQRQLQQVLGTIRWRISNQLASYPSISLDNGIAQYTLDSHLRLDRDFLGFPHYN